MNTDALRLAAPYRKQVRLRIAAWLLTNYLDLRDWLRLLPSMGQRDEIRQAIYLAKIHADRDLGEPAMDSYGQTWDVDSLDRLEDMASVMSSRVPRLENRWASAQDSRKDTTKSGGRRSGSNRERSEPDNSGSRI